MKKRAKDEKNLLGMDQGGREHTDCGEKQRMLGQTAAGVLTTKLLEWSGYQADGRITEGVKQGILFNYIWFPVLFSLVIIVLMSFYPSLKKKSQEIGG